jgi:hypothetical protein
MNNSALKETDPLLIVKYRTMDGIRDADKVYHRAADKYSSKFNDVNKGMNKVSNAGLGVSYMEHNEKLFGFDFNEYLQLAYKILSDTQTEYRYLTNMVKLHYSKTNLTEADLKDYFIQNRPQTVCSQEVMKEIMKILLADNHKVHIEYLEKYNYEKVIACCIPQHIPNDICLYTDVIHKVYELKYFMHELGHAISLSNTFPKLEFLHAYLYNEIMQEAYASFYENLVLYNREFQENFGIQLPQAEIESCRFEDLYQIRLLAVKLIYQKDYYSSDKEDYLRNLYQDIMKKYMLINYNSSCYANESVIGVTNIKNFIGKIIAYKLQLGIENRFGQRWFQEVKASEVLNNIYSHGGLVNPNNYSKFLVS